MSLWCWALLLQGLEMASAVRGSSGDACATMCAPGEDGRCVYWPSSASRADLAELFCLNCTIGGDEGCSGPLCGTMCRLVDGKCTYHPSLSAKPNVEELYCMSCPYCGYEGSLRYFSTKRLEEDERLVADLEAMKAKTDKQLEIELGKIEQSNNETDAANEALSRSAVSEHSATRTDQQLDGSVVDLISHQALEETRLEVDDMRHEANELSSDEATAEQHLTETEDVLNDIEDDMKQAAHDERKAASSGDQAEMDARRGHVLEDAAKVAELRVESSKVQSAVDKADMKAKQVQSLSAETARAAEQAAEQVQEDDALALASNQVAATEAQIASLAGQETDAVQTAGAISHRHDDAMSKVAQVEETMRSLQEAADSAGRATVQAHDGTKAASQRAALQADVAGSAGKAFSGVRVLQGIDHLETEATSHLNEVSHQLAVEQAALHSVGDHRSASDVLGEAAAQASLHAKQAALDAANKFDEARKHPHPHHPSPPAPPVPPMPPVPPGQEQEVRLEPIREVLQALPAVMPKILAFGLR
mmetsp:Transcript_69574/g.165944  ORF Transcript_69574/g.165944 Transcript_69574/m.165944 type:complete len:534 (+) Transcript_69574:98-1699(+)